MKLNLTERETFFKYLLDTYVFADGEADGWQTFGASKYAVFGNPNYVIVETGEDPDNIGGERVFIYKSFEEMFYAWKTNFQEAFCDYQTLLELGVNLFD